MANWTASNDNDTSATTLSVTSSGAADPDTEIVAVLVSGVTAAPATAVCTSDGATVVEWIPLQTDNNVWGAAWLLTNVQPSTAITVTLNTGKTMTLVADAHPGSGIGAMSAVGTRTDTSNLTTIPAFTAEEIDSLILDGWIHRDTATTGTPAGVTVLTVDEGTIDVQLDGSTSGTGATAHSAISVRGPLGTTAVGDVAGTYKDGAGVVNRTSTNAFGRSVEILAGTPPPPTSGQVTTTWVADAGPDFIRGSGIDVPPGASVRMVVSEDVGLEFPVYSGTVTVPASGWLTAKVTGLDPSTVYYLGWEIGGVLQTDGRFTGKTLPAVGVREPLVVLTASCQSNGADHPLFDLMAAEGADWVEHLGDMTYVDPENESEWRAGIEVALSLPNMKAMLAALPMRYVAPDNHDGDNWDSQAPGGFISAGMREINGDYPNATLHYKTWAAGQVARFIRTDMWGARSDIDDAEGPSKTLLGSTQKSWFFTTLEEATEDILLWEPGWPTYRIGGGRWNSYSTETQEIQDWIDARPEIKRRMIIVGADSHNVLGYDGVAAASNLWFSGIPSLSASPISQFGNATGMTNTDFNIVRDNSVNGTTGDGFYGRHEFDPQPGYVTYTWSAVKYDGTTAAVWSKTFYTTDHFRWNGSEWVPQTLTVGA